MSWRRALSEVAPNIRSSRLQVSLLSPPFRLLVASRRVSCTAPTRPLPYISHRRRLSSVAFPSVTDPDTLLQQIRDAIATSDVPQIRAVYETLLGDTGVSELQDSQKEAVISSLHTLALSGDPQDLRLIDMVLGKMHHHWNFPVTPDIHSTILKGLLKTAEDSTVTRWLLKMPTKPGKWKASPAQWNDFLVRCQQGKKPHLVKSTVNLMRFSGCTPNETTYTIFLHALFRSQLPPPRFSVVREIVKDMQNDKVPFTYAMRDLIAEAYTDHGSLNLARQTENLHWSILGSDSLDKVNATRARQLADASMQGMKRARELLANFRKEGFVPNRRTLATVVEGSKSYKELQAWEDLLEVNANTFVFAVVIKNAAEVGNRYEVLELLRIAHKVRRLPMTVDMVHPALRLLCTSKFSAPSDKQVNHAIFLLRQYLHQYDDGAFYKEVVFHTPSDDLPLYNTIIRALTQSSNPRSYELAISYLEEMQSRGVTADSMSMASVLVILMKLSRNPSEAYSVYKIARKDKNGRLTLDPKGYVVILDAFCKQTMMAPHTEFATDFYFEIVKDMRTAGYPVPVEVYTIILRQLGERITSLPQTDTELRDRLIKIVKRIHTLITMDGALVPDIFLWNELMDTYQRAGCFRDAFNLWQNMCVSRRYDNASVSIILDACAYANAHETAVEIYHKILDDGFRFNQKNWDNWIECLCRLGKIDEALKVFCLEMLREEGVEPSVKSFKTLLTFSVRTNQESLVRTRVKRYLPKFWATLPEYLRGAP